MRRAKAGVAAAKRLEHTDNTAEIEKQGAFSEQFVKYLHDLSISTGLPANSVELLRKAVAEKILCQERTPSFCSNILTLGDGCTPCGDGHVAFHLGGSTLMI